MSSRKEMHDAVVARANDTVDQWDNHDIHRQTEADMSLIDPAIGEPHDVAIARSLIRLDNAIRNAIDNASGRESEWGQRAEDCFQYLNDAIEGCEP